MIYDRAKIQMKVIKDREGRLLHELAEGNEVLDDLDLTGAQLSGIIAEGLCCMDTKFIRADLRGADLYWAMARGADFRGADLSGASFRGANLKDCNFSEANLTNADFSTNNLGSSTRLQGAVLQEAIMTGARFDAAEFDHRTVFPDGFDPMTHSMKLVDS